MKVTVTKYLNVRVGKPSLNAPCYQYLAPGSEIEVDGKLYQGDWYEGANEWYQDKAGNYYWSGGFAQSIQSIAQASIDYDQFLSTYQGNGTGVSVALIDSGFNTSNSYLNSLMQEYESFLPGRAKQPVSNHGPAIAGIIATTDPQVNRNTSALYCYRVADLKDNVNNTAVKDALEWIISKHLRAIDIINMSIDIVGSQVRIIQPLIDQLYQNGVIVVVSAGENNYTNNIALLANAIKIASFDSNKFTQIKLSGLNKQYSFAFLNDPVLSYSNVGQSLIYHINQDSAYAAVITALLARELSKNTSVPRNSARLAWALSYLKSQSELITQQQNPKPFTIYA